MEEELFIRYGGDTGVTFEQACNKLKSMGYIKRDTNKSKTGIVRTKNGEYWSSILSHNDCKSLGFKEIFVHEGKSDISKLDFVEYNGRKARVMGITGKMAHISYKGDSALKITYAPLKDLKKISQKEYESDPIESCISKLSELNAATFSCDTTYVSSTEPYNPNKKTMNNFEQIQSDEFFSKKKNINDIKQVRRSLSVQHDIFQDALEKIKRIESSLRDLGKTFERALDLNDFEGLEKLIPDINEKLNFLARYQERTIFDIAELPDTNQKQSPEEFFGL